MQNSDKREHHNRHDKYEDQKKYNDYYIVFIICVAFTIIAFCSDSPKELLFNYIKINTTRCVLITDYVALGGVGAALLNSAILGFINLYLVKLNKPQPNGKLMAGLYVTIGFSLFGKNLFNTLPIMAGVWLNSRANKKRFSDQIFRAMLSGTIAPIVSEVAFQGNTTSVIKIAVSYLIGIFIGFVFPIVIEAVKRMHRGYCLYNAGIAGGFIATFFVCLYRSLGYAVLPENYWDTSHTFFLAAIAYSIAGAMILYAIIREGPLKALRKYVQLLKECDHNDNDYFFKYRDTCYINIGVMCIVSTSLMLFLKIPINGPVLGGIFTVCGFAAAGKHLLNTIPVFAGSVAAAYFNHMDVTASLNSLAILFSTGLAPVTGKHGWYSGVAVGFLHVSVAIFIADLNGGLNLYNSGFAGGFVAITFVPMIVFLKETYHSHKHIFKRKGRSK